MKLKRLLKHLSIADGEQEIYVTENDKIKKLEDVSQIKEGVLLS